MEYLTYITQDNDRWDSIAYRFYGDAMRYRSIIEANPHVRIVSALPAGLILKIPIIEKNQVVADSALPPWKRK